jgi:TolC family type I secretion outer membrane protein
MKEIVVLDKASRRATRRFSSTIAHTVLVALACLPVSMLTASFAHGESAVPSGPLPDGSTVAEQAAPRAVTFRDPYAEPGTYAPVRFAEAGEQPVIPLPPPPNPTIVPPQTVGDQFPPSPPPPIDYDKPLTAADSIAPRASDEPPAGALESLRNTIVAALKSNPDIQIALARQDDARYGVHQANAGYLPHADMTIAVGREFNDPYNTKTASSTSNRTTLTRKEASITVNQNVWDFGTTINDIKRARASYRSAQWGTREKIEAISYEISTAYLNVLERQKLLDLTGEEIKAHEKILNVVKIQNDLGLITPADVDRARARLESVQSEVLDRKSALQQAREAYRRLTEHLPGITTDLPSPAAALPPTAAEAVAMIDDHSPRMAQAVEDRRSLDRQKASQTGTFFPRIGLQAQGNWKDDVQGNTNFNRDARAMVTLSYSFFNGGADIAIRNRISARLREADYELERRRREVEQDIRIDFQALEAARGKIATIESEIASATRVVDLYRAQFREGKRSVFDLLDSQQLLFNARTNQITNGTAKMLAEFRVLQKLGGLFDLVSSGEPLPPLVMPAPGAKK